MKLCAAKDKISPMNLSELNPNLPGMLGAYAAALEAKKEAEKLLANQSGEFDYSKAASQLAEAAARLRTIQQLRKKH